MKKINLYVLLVICLINGKISFSQSLIKTAEGSSGVLIGAQNNSEFAGVNYNRTSNEFTLDYRLKKQESLNLDINNPFPSTYPNFSSHNIGFSVGLNDSKSLLVSESKIKAKLGINYTYAFVIDLTKPSNKDKEVKTKVTYYNGPGGEIFDSRELCECCQNRNRSDSISIEKPCDSIVSTVSHKLINRSSRVGFVRQHAFFITGENKIDRLNTVSTDTINNDSIFLKFENPLQNSSNIRIGWNYLYQVSDKLFLSPAISLNFNLLTKSIGGLKKSSFQSNTSTFFNSKDSSLVLNGGQEKEYYLGNTQQEFIFSPRFDFFIRYRLGDETKPYLGLLGSVAPRYSSIDIIKNRVNYSIGPSISLPKLPDQILFAIMLEWIEDNDDNHDFGLTFHAGIPIYLK